MLAWTYNTQVELTKTNRTATMGPGEHCQQSPHTVQSHEKLFSYISFLSFYAFYEKNSPSAHTTLSIVAPYFGSTRNKAADFFHRKWCCILPKTKSINTDIFCIYFWRRNEHFCSTLSFIFTPCSFMNLSKFLTLGA